MKRRLALFTVIAGSTFLAALASPAPTASTALKRVQDSYEAFLERENLGVRTRRALPIESLPDLSLAKAEKDAAFGRSLSQGLAAVAPKELTHEEELSY